MKNPHVSFTVVVRTLGVASVKVILAILLAVIPIFGIASAVIAVRSLGWSVGRIQALVGRESELYN